MKRRQTLRHEEGNVLYLTLIMMMVLVLFTLGLTNIIITVVHKIKTQQLADHMVLSTASLKAQYLNENANINSIIAGWLLSNGTIDAPFASSAEADIMSTKIVDLIKEMQVTGEDYNNRIKSTNTLDQLADANGLNKQTTRLGIIPKDIDLDQHMQISYQEVYIKSPTPPYYQPYGQMPAYYEPKINLSVQARVERMLQNKLIGQKLLPLTVPLIITRSRAEIIDTGQLKSPLGRSWHVRLASPYKQVDDILKRKDNN